MRFPFNGKFHREQPDSLTAWIEQWICHRAADRRSNIEEAMQPGEKQAGEFWRPSYFMTRNRAFTS